MTGNIQSLVSSRSSFAGFTFADGLPNGCQLRRDGTAGNCLHGLQIASSNPDYIPRIVITYDLLPDAPPAMPAVPELATWALMMVGFGAVGTAMRRKQAGTRVRFA